MGQFTEGEVIIVAKTKKTANAIFNEVSKLDEYITSKSDQPFSTSITDIRIDDDCVYIKLSSDRYPNAEWQCEQILELVKEKFENKLSSFTADLTVPENIIYETFD